MNGAFGSERHFEARWVHWAAAGFIALRGDCWMEIMSKPNTTCLYYIGRAQARDGEIGGYSI